MRLHNYARTSRRSFLKTACAASFAAPLLAAGSKKVMVGAHPWIYAKPRPNWDLSPILDDIFSDFKYAGMDGIEMMWTMIKPEAEVQHIADVSAKHKLPIIGMSYTAHMYDRSKHAETLDELSLLLPRLHKLGGRTLGISVETPGRKKTTGELDAQAELLRKVFALCAANQVVGNLHNHTYEVQDDLYDLKGTLARIPDAKLGPDIGWLAYAKVDPVNFIHRYGKQMVFAHIRDMNADDTWAESVGEGVVDYRAIGKALHHANFSGDLVVELAYSGKVFKPTRPLRDSLKMSRNYIRTAMGY